MSRRAPSDNREVDPRVETWMRRAVALAAPSQPHPNPRVGAVVLTPTGDEIGAAAHLGPGTPHAEVLALAQAVDTDGATLVTTLEPCTHYGATPPCVDAIVRAGVSRVIVGAIDPDARVSGSGVAKLRAAGIDVTHGVLAGNIERADPGYFHSRRHGRPRFRVKLAATLDGQAAAADGTSQWITSDAARRDAHRLRAESDAVLIGAGTLRADNPRLDARTVGFTGKQPRPVVVAGRRPLPANRLLYARQPLIYSPAPRDASAGSELVVAPGGEGVDLQIVAKDLVGRGILDVLIDGGPTIAGAFVRAGLADQLILYMGASIGTGLGRPMFEGVFATLSDAVECSIDDVAKIGPDLRIDVTLTEERR